jgi:protein-disulfide isomerase
MTIRFPKFLPALIGAMLALFLAVPLQAQEDQSFTPKQQEAIRKLIKETLMENPGIIADAIDALRMKEDLAAELAAKKALTERKDEIFNDPDSPVVGNAKGDVTIVEFFDYRCPYCKATVDILMEAVKNDGKVKLVLKDFPVLGPESNTAARAALASREQKKYEEFHKALMHLKEPLTDKSLMKVAAEVGLNVEKLKKDMEDQKIDQILKNNIRLAHDLDVSGTPAFVIGDQLVPGAISAQSLKQLIDQTRKAKG